MLDGEKVTFVGIVIAVRDGKTDPGWEDSIDLACGGTPVTLHERASEFLCGDQVQVDCVVRDGKYVIETFRGHPDICPRCGEHALNVNNFQFAATHAEIDLKCPSCQFDITEGTN